MFEVQEQNGKYVVIDTLSGALAAESGSKEGAQEVCDDLNKRREEEDAAADALAQDVVETISDDEVTDSAAEKKGAKK